VLSSSCYFTQNPPFHYGKHLNAVPKKGNWNFHSLVLSLPGAKVPWVELSSPGTFAPESENNIPEFAPRMENGMQLSLDPCPKIVVVIPCTRPVEACRPSEAILSRSRSNWNNCRLGLLA